jgi:diacylglycerol kinase (ATP)
MLIAVCLLGLIVELLNSAVEAAIDRISLERTHCRKTPRTWAAPRNWWLTMIALVWA